MLVEGIQQPPGWPRQVQRHLNEALDFKHWLRRMGQGQCELVHTAVAQLRALYMLIMGNGHWGDTMQHGFKLASQEASLSHWGFAVQVAMALIAIVLLTLTSAALETFLLGDESLTALKRP
jgi:hypothetical protein